MEHKVSKNKPRNCILVKRKKKEGKNPEKCHAPTFTVTRKILSEKQHVSILIGNKCKFSRLATYIALLLKLGQTSLNNFVLSYFFREPIFSKK